MSEVNVERAQRVSDALNRAQADDKDFEDCFADRKVLAAELGRILASLDLATLRRVMS
jgi:hypothetical protein